MHILIPKKSAMNQLKRSKIIEQIFLYLIVGGIATLVEWVLFYIFDAKLGIHYIPATALAFMVSTFANWLAGKLILFEDWSNVIPEIVKIYAASIAGLFFNLVLMWIMVDIIGLQEMVSKIIATGIVFMWNFLIRKYAIYKI